MEWNRIAGTGVAGLHVPRENSKTTETILIILVAITEIFVKNVISSQDIKKYKLTQR